MKNLLLILLLLFSFAANSQAPFKENQRLVLKEDGWFTLSMGTGIIAANSYIHYRYGKTSDKRVVAGGLIFSTIVGIGLDVISFKLKPRKSRPKFL